MDCSDWYARLATTRRSMISEELKKEILNRIGAIVKARAKRLAPIDTGDLRASIDWRLEGDSVVIFCDVEYADDMEYGKPPEPLSSEEKEDLKVWAQKRNLPAYPIIRKIEREGIKVGTVENPIQVPNGTYRPFLRPALHQSMPEIRNMIRRMLDGNS